MAEGDKSPKPSAGKEAPAAAKSKKARGKKDEAKKVGYAANIEEGLEPKPARLRVRFRQEGVPALMKQFSFKNPNQVPRLEKIVLNMGLGEALANNKIMESAGDQLLPLPAQRRGVPRA